MLTMGRRRKIDGGMQPRVYQKAGVYYYVHAEKSRWERLGTDLAEANRKARIYNDPDALYGTLVYWLDRFLLDCDRRQAAGKMAARTVEDYRNAIVGTPIKPGALRLFFSPPITPHDLTPAMVQEFLAVNDELGRPVPANREKSCLSSAMSWLIRTGECPGLHVNPCLRASGIKRNPETPRDRYVTHDEYHEVYALASTSVRLLMELTYRTLQRPDSDIIHWTTQNIASTPDGIELRFTQHKTKQPLRIRPGQELAAMLRQAVGGSVVRLKQHLVHTQSGEAYKDYDGISAMLRRYIIKANEARAARGIAAMPSFGFRDLKGKGATDMWLAGEPIETIQQLCGHKQKSTTEIYIKQRWRETLDANAVDMQKTAT